MANDIIVQYGSNQQLESVNGEMPFYDNSDTTKYIESDGIRVYNSAILSYNSTAYWILLFNTSEDVINQFNGSSFRTTTYYTKQGNNCYSRYVENNPSLVFLTTTLNGVEVYYNDNDTQRGSIGNSNIPIFYDPQEFRNYITLNNNNGGGAGSGYIGNSLLSNKKMVGYNVPTSSAEGTKTESVNEISASAVANKPKSGNGHARIKFLREIDINEDSWYTIETQMGIWTNGKPVYQIAIPNIDKTLVRNWDVLADVSSLNIDEIIKIDLLGIANSSFEGSLVAIHGAQVGLLNNNIVGYAHNSNIVPYAQTVKIRYTKTTD